VRTAYLFDVDGTLTPPAEKMQEDFIYFFLEWSGNKDFFLVGGSPYKVITSQIPSSILSRSKGIFSSMGNQLHIHDIPTYSYEWKPPVSLLSRLLEWHSKSPYPHKRKKYLEFRTGMLNFAVAGRESTKEERSRYFAWDTLYGERKSIASDLSEEFPQLDIRVGGMISLDIQPKGRNKTQALNWVRELNKYDSLVYFGDKGFKGGNDYDAKLNIREHKDGKFYDVKDCNDAKKILLSLG
jgi:HAD superfamily hydrolase (TIGR01484 family)|tara:strand:+ start:9765 stop:10481 length:717 start_codon:yes stop_codon:yes gene_type:complete